MFLYLFLSVCFLASCNSARQKTGGYKPVLLDETKFTISKKDFLYRFDNKLAIESNELDIKMGIGIYDINKVKFLKRLANNEFKAAFMQNESLKARLIDTLSYHIKNFDLDVFSIKIGEFFVFENQLFAVGSFNVHVKEMEETDLLPHELNPNQSLSAIFKLNKDYQIIDYHIDCTNFAYHTDRSHYLENFDNRIHIHENKMFGKVLYLDFPERLNTAKAYSVHFLTKDLKNIKKELWGTASNFYQISDFKGMPNFISVGGAPNFYQDSSNKAELLSISFTGKGEFFVKPRPIDIGIKLDLMATVTKGSETSVCILRDLKEKDVRKTRFYTTKGLNMQTLRPITPPPGYLLIKIVFNTQSKADKVYFLLEKDENYYLWRYM